MISYDKKLLCLVIWVTIDPTAIIDVKVRDIMTERVITVESSRTVKEAVDKMVEKDIECLPVIRNGLLCGLITFRDIIIKAIYMKKNINETNVEEIMTRSVTTCSSDTTVLKIVKLMKDKHLRRLPVVETNNKIVGIVTDFDLAIFGWKI